MEKGKFIVFEGCDGSGKTTVSAACAQKLQEEGYKVIYTREPGGIEIAEQIRKVILNPDNTAMDPRTEALLYAASRRQHLVEKVLPALEQGIHVICDRFVISSLVYQGYARKIGVDEVMRVNDFAIEGHFPDYIIYLEIDPMTGLERVKNRTFLDRLDKEDLSFHQDVHEGYRKVSEMFADKIVSFDASCDADTVIGHVMDYLREIL